MRHPRAIRFVSWTSLLVLALAGIGLVQAQEPGARATAGATAAGQDTQVLIGHALAMAIDGSALHMTASRSGEQGGRQQGEGREGAQGQMKDAPQELRRHAREAYDGARRLFSEASNLVRQEGARPGADRPGAGQVTGTRPSSQRLYEAANQYTRTLWELTGEATGEGRQGEGDRPSRSTPLSDNDYAALCVINHSVKEGIEAFELRQLTAATGPRGAASRQLQAHAQEMATHAQQALQKWAGQEGGERESKPGQASVQTLAMQGREVVSLFQQLSEQAGARGPGGAITPRERGTPGAPGERRPPGERP